MQNTIDARAYVTDTEIRFDLPPVTILGWTFHVGTRIDRNGDLHPKVRVRPLGEFVLRGCRYNVQGPPEGPFVLEPFPGDDDRLDAEAKSGASDMLVREFRDALGPANGMSSNVVANSVAAMCALGIADILSRTEAPDDDDLQRIACWLEHVHGVAADRMPYMETALDFALVDDEGRPLRFRLRDSFVGTILFPDPMSLVRAATGCGASGTPAEILAALMPEARMRLVMSGPTTHEVVRVVGSFVKRSPLLEDESVPADVVVAKAFQGL